MKLYSSIFLRKKKTAKRNPDQMSKYCRMKPNQMSKYCRIKPQPNVKILRNETPTKMSKYCYLINSILNMFYIHYKYQ